MKFTFRNQIMKRSARVLQVVLGMLLLCGLANAGPIFHVNVNTSSLMGSSSSPFSLDFQFNNGSLLGNNTATVTNFFGGVGVGSPTLFDGAAGNINSSVVFNNTGSFQELYQTFTPGSSLSFDVLLTSNVDSGTPDAFVFSILDKNLFNIPTTGLGDSLLLINLDRANPSAQTFAGTGAFSGVTASVSTVPEPATVVMLLTGLPLIALAARRKKNKITNQSA